ncbi:MAG TPA: hypothetical protein VG603_08540 [Chitinophagales bacterium]|nr:hypothetical protein [Chitinophagales bacterium]
MSVTKHKHFKFRIDNEKADLNEADLKVMADFLSDPNNVYISHSSSVFEAKKISSGSFREAFMFINIIYKDLNATENDLKKVSKKGREVVRKSMEQQGASLPMPNIQTSFDKAKKVTK